jgi:hypothetical protein
MAELEVPKSSPQASMVIPVPREGDVIYYDKVRLARLFFWTYADAR